MEAPRLGDCEGVEAMEALEEARATRERSAQVSDDHLCGKCVHARICSVAKAIEHTVGLGLVVSQCPEYFGVDEMEANEVEQ